MSFTRRLLLVLLLAGGAATLVVSRLATDSARLVILISVDTTRPERLGIYGGPPGTSPNIDALAQDSVVFDQVLATSPWTLPSHMTMLTGLDPVAHGVRNSDFKLSGRVTTLAEAFKKAGFRTAAFTAGGFVSARYGFGQGFEIYRETMEPDGTGSGFARIMPEALDWIDKNRREDSFVFLHTFDVHTPYDKCSEGTLAEFRARPVQDRADDYQLHRLSYFAEQNKVRVTEYARMGNLLNDYDAGVHEADRGIGELLHRLRAANRLDNAVIIVTSDHGESFADHGLHIGHGLALTDDELHVPLVLHLPKRQLAGQRIPALADLGDVAPTLLELMGVPRAPEMDGENLTRLAAGGQRHRDYVMGMSQNTDSCFVVKDGFKFISSPSMLPLDVARRHLGPMTPPATGADPGEEYVWPKNSPSGITLHYDFKGDPLGIRDVLPEIPQLYDRAKDPKELTNLYLQDKPRVALMAALLKELFERSAALAKSMEDGQTALPEDPKLQNMLNTLGYVLAPDPNAARISLGSLPQSLREPLRNPYVPPDITELILADERAQFIRRNLEDHLELPDHAQRVLQELGNQYVAWAVRNPEHVAYVRWRVEALTELAKTAGVTLDMDKWRRRFIQLDAKSAEAREAAVEANRVSPDPASTGTDAGDARGVQTDAPQVDKPPR